MLPARNVTLREELPHASAYELLLRIASGGMGTVYVGRKKTARVGRLYAIKRAHPHILDNRAYVQGLANEGWLASRIHHPNVAAVHDVEELDGEFLLVMDYVEGVAASTLFERAQWSPSYVRAVVRIVLDACAGLAAAHELRGEQGEPLDLVHRDVSPHNVLVGIDGVARVTDFGLAKVRRTLDQQQTASGILRGKAAYMAPEYVSTGTIDARCDVFSMAVVAWELLTKQRLFGAANELETLQEIVAGPARKPSDARREVAWADEVIGKAIERDPNKRFSTMSEFSSAFEKAAARAGVAGTASAVRAVLNEACGAELEERAQRLREGSRSRSGSVPDGSPSNTDEVATKSLPRLDAPASPTSTENTRAVESARAGASSRRSPVVGLLALAGAAAATAFAVHLLRLDPPRTPPPAPEPTTTTPVAEAPAPTEPPPSAVTSAAPTAESSSAPVPSAPASAAPSARPSRPTPSKPTTPAPIRSEPAAAVAAASASAAPATSTPPVASTAPTPAIPSVAPALPNPY